MALARPDQAEQHYEIGSRLLKEAGAAPTGELFRAWRGAPGRRAARRSRSRRPLRRFRPSRSQRRVRKAFADRRQRNARARAEPPLVGRDAELDRLRAL